MSSPLGQYGPLVAAVAALGVLAAFIIAVLFQPLLGLPDSSIQSLREFGLLALGAVFGSAAAITASRAELDTAHRRLDAIGAPSTAAVDGREGAQPPPG